MKATAIKANRARSINKNLFKKKGFELYILEEKEYI
jgi:hypothetical protein